MGVAAEKHSAISTRIDSSFSLISLNWKSLDIAGNEQPALPLQASVN